MKFNEIITIDLDEVVNADGIDGFNELICEATGEPDLQEISWHWLPGDVDGLIRVMGWIEEEEE